MLDPISILNYYPTYTILDELLEKGYKKINLFVDLKNCLQSIYMRHVTLGMLENTQNGNQIDSSILSSLISFLGFHKTFSLKRGIKITYYIFYDMGRSFWHENVFKDYKKSRKQDDLYGLSRKNIDMYFKILQANFLLIRDYCNSLPNVYAICLEHFEADFIPYFLIKNKLVDMDSDACQLIYSNDKDLFQTESLGESIFQFIRKPQAKFLLNYKEAMNYFLKSKKDYPAEYFSTALAILGDSSDGVPGIKGIGNVWMERILPTIIEMGDGAKNILNNAYEGNPIFIKKPKEMNKYIDLVIREEEKYGTVSRNLKLVDFNILCRVIEEYPFMEYRKKKISIEEFIYNKNVESYEAMRRASDFTRLELDDGSLELLYS